ncbi:helicase-associated domain-containing protein [Spongisporangium articulatum]|uniref:Helicase-associated domain-containing protein n=1 Tax=Spongisporangium articulatum TaxID=3362603 RepID=A0ABW8AJH0_9ACTN
MATPAPRSLADDLRARDDDALADLLARRPDLATPPPPDLGTLATAAAGRLSVQRAIDGLDAATLQVVQVIAALPEPVTAAEVGRRWGRAATEQLTTLRDLALVWGGPRALRPVRAVRDVLGPHPAGLGPPLADALGRRSPQRLEELLHDLGLPPTGDPEQALAALAAHLGAPGTAAALLDAAPEPVRDGARAVLERLTWGPPVGQVEDADRPVRAGSAASPVEWLLAHGLLAVADAGHVVLPREVGLALRGGRVFREPDVAPPALRTTLRPVGQVAAGAAQAGSEAVRLVELLARTWATDPPSRLRGGGLSVRDLRRTATLLELDDGLAALVAELALAAGLVADDGEIDPHFLPTAAYDDWRALPVGARWAAVAAAWLATPRAPSLVGSRVRGAGGKETPVAALGPDVDRPLAPRLRREALAELAGLPDEGENRPALSDPTGADLLARLDWYAPRRTAAARVQLLRASMSEAAWLGLTGSGALSPAGAAVLAGDPRSAAEAFESALPAPVDQVLIQADLTAVAPGRVAEPVAAELELVADVESRGAATVYRFSTASVRRALDAGRTADDLHDFLAKVSSTPVPQPLTYLVDDSARRHGRLRVGTASAYLRADDEATLAELLADRRAAPLGLRRLAPTVLAAQAAAPVVLSTLRSLGLSPAAESPNGDLVIPKTEPRRAPSAPRPRRVGEPGREDLLLAVRSMRAVEENGRRPVPTDVTPPELPTMDPAGSIAVLRDAVAERRDVWIGYLENAGHQARHIVEPLAVEAGRVRALDRQTGQIRLYSVHRVIGVVPA